MDWESQEETTTFSATLHDTAPADVKFLYAKELTEEQKCFKLHVSKSNKFKLKLHLQVVTLNLTSKIDLPKENTHILIHLRIKQITSPKPNWNWPILSQYEVSNHVKYQSLKCRETHLPHLCNLQTFRETPADLQYLCNHGNWLAAESFHHGYQNVVCLPPSPVSTPW